MANHQINHSNWNCKWKKNNYFHVFIPNFQTWYVQYLVKLLSWNTKYNSVYQDFELYIFEEKMLRQELLYFKTENLKFKETLDQFLKLSPKLKSGISLKSKCLGLKISINELIRLLPKMKKIITNNLLVPYLKREQRMKFCLKKRQAFDGKSQRSWSKNGNRICKN